MFAVVTDGTNSFLLGYSGSFMRQYATSILCIKNRNAGGFS